jgi:hypothetical protein
MVEYEHLHNLIYLNINKCEFCQNTKEICQFLNNIWSLPKLTHCYLDISFKEQRVVEIIDPSIISTSLQHLTIKSMSHRLTHLAHIFQCTSSLRYLDIMNHNYPDDTPISIPIPSIIALKIDFAGSLSVLTDLLQNMPNLRHLTVGTDDIDINGHQWEYIITNHLPKLQVFQFEMTFNPRNGEDKEQRVNELLKSFQTRFWLEEHQWFVRCDWDRCQRDYCINQIYLYTLPYTFNYYAFHDSIIKAKSTCPDNNIYPSYNQVHILDYAIAPSENRVLPQFTFSNIHDLILYLPVDDNFWSIMPQFDHLKSLKMIPHDTDQYDFDSQFQLQTILDRAPRLYSLGFGAWSSTSMGMPPFEYSNKSVRRLNLIDVDRVYNSQQCVTLSRSSLGMQCEVLSITVENRTTIIDLLNTMPNLRALNVLSRDDSWKDEDDDSSPSKNDELVEWLQHRLPFTYTITRNSNKILYSQSLKSFWSVLLWIS